MRTIILERTTHRGQDRIKLFFEFDPVIMNLLDTIEGVKWSSTMSCWHAPYVENFQEIFRIKFGNSAQLVDMSDKSKRLIQGEINSRNMIALEHFFKFMKNRRYADQTIKNYMKRIRDFLQYFPDKEIELITNFDVRQYNYERIIKEHRSKTLQNQFVTALGLFLSTVRESKIKIEDVERAKNSRRLPVVFSKAEIEKILNCTQNLKHKNILLLTYACGLRRNEIGTLLINDINADRRVIMVRNSKGSKDRYVPVSVKVLESLRSYYKVYRPKHYIFETSSGTKYHPETIYKIFKRALEKSGIDKQVGIHSLRHSYATHLMESGTELRYIQTILGHKSLKTTEIYTHVSNHSISNIICPADELCI